MSSIETDLSLSPEAFDRGSFVGMEFKTWIYPVQSLDFSRTKNKINKYPPDFTCR